MRTRYAMATALMALAAWGAVGCQNQMTIRVDRVLVESELSALQPNSRLGASVAQTINSLRRLNQTYETMVEKTEAADKAGHFSALMIDIKERRGKVEAAIQTLAALFDEENAVELGPRIRWELLRAGVLLDQQKDFLKEWKPKFARSAKDVVDKATQEAYATLAKEVDVQFDEGLVQVDAGKASANRGGFGGFEWAGACEINPADPQYGRILDANPQKLSKESLTYVKVDTSGDSTVMIVMEAPGQFRLYKVNTDPTTLLNNLSTIMQKVVSAALKFATAI